MAKTPQETALKILNDNIVGTMATVQQDRPHSRYMTFFHDDFLLYTVTSKKTHKAEELKQNPYTHILVGYDGKGLGDAFLEIEGKVEESQDENLRKKVWNKILEPWFDGPDDPDLLILKITPSSIRLMNKLGEEPQIIDF